MKRIALYGGTFDPVHNGHLAVARTIVQLFALDEVWLMPAYIAPHKRHALPPSAAWHRHALLALATQNDAALRIATLELDAPSKPYTVETLSTLRATLTDTRLFFVMGLDSWLDIKTWREWEKVLTLADHIVVERPGYAWRDDHVTPEIRARVVNLRGAPPENITATVAHDGGNRIYATDAVRLDISATDIRRAVRDGETDFWQAQVPRAVAAYIEKYGLYR